MEYTVIPLRQYFFCSKFNFNSTFSTAKDDNFLWPVCPSLRPPRQSGNAIAFVELKPFGIFESTDAQTLLLQSYFRLPRTWKLDGQHCEVASFTGCLFFHLRKVDHRQLQITHLASLVDHGTFLDCSNTTNGNSRIAMEFLFQSGLPVLWQIM